MYFIVAAVLAVAPVDCKECKQYSKSCVSGAAVNISPAKKVHNRLKTIRNKFRRGGKNCG